MLVRVSTFQQRGNFATSAYKTGGSVRRWAVFCRLFGTVIVSYRSTTEGGNPRSSRLVVRLSPPPLRGAVDFPSSFDGAFISFVRRFVLGIKLGGLHEDG